MASPAQSVILLETDSLNNGMKIEADTRLFTKGNTSDDYRQKENELESSLEKQNIACTKEEQEVPIRDFILQTLDINNDKRKRAMNSLVPMEENKKMIFDIQNNSEESKISKLEEPSGHKSYTLSVPDDMTNNHESMANENYEEESRKKIGSNCQDLIECMRAEELETKQESGVHELKPTTQKCVDPEVSSLQEVSSEAEETRRELCTDEEIKEYKEKHVDCKANKRATESHEETLKENPPKRIKRENFECPQDPKIHAQATICENRETNSTSTDDEQLFYESDSNSAYTNVYTYTDDEQCSFDESDSNSAYTHDEGCSFYESDSNSAYTNVEELFFDEYDSSSDCTEVSRNENNTLTLQEEEPSNNELNIIYSTQVSKDEQNTLTRQEEEPSNNEPNIIYEKSESNSELIHKILTLLGNEVSNSWETTDQKPYALIAVPKNTIEYSKVHKIFSLTCREVKMEKLERVQNSYILAHFLMKKEKLRQENFSVEEKYLFHGTREEYVDGICKHNFDWRRCESSRGHKFGQGVSFSPEVTYSRHYSPISDKVMILTKVLVSKSTVGHSGMAVPPSSYDTTQNGPGTVFVKYEDDDFYPEYVIHYGY